MVNQEKQTKSVAAEIHGDGKFERIPLDKLKNFKSHAFKPYSGDKLDRLVQSIRANGIIQPIVVRQARDSDTYEILSGHNRVEAAKKAGMAEVNAVVRELSDDEAIIFVNEANLIQRSFENWLPSEKIASIKQYHDAIKRQGSRTDKGQNTSGEVPQKSEDKPEGYARERTAKAYGVTENTIKVFLRLHHLGEKLRIRLDSKEFGITSAQHLSHTSKNVQNIIDSVLNEGSLNTSIDKAREIRKSFAGKFKAKPSEIEAEEVKTRIKEILATKADKSKDEDAEKFKAINMEADEYNRLFPEMTADEALEEIIFAIEYYREVPSKPMIPNDVSEES